MTQLTPSPLNVLLRHRDRDDTALLDALVLTFNHDLAFFEREVLALLQLTGARLTVVGDVRVTGHDLYAVRHAGTAYLPGLTSCPGAFHPKLLVLVGRDEVTVAIGSGNLTLAGWRGNDELWSVHRAWLEGGSVVPAQVGAFVSLLPDVVQVVPAVAEALRRVGTALASFPGESVDHQVVSSLTRPIIEQLPTGPVDELLLYAPFHDESAAAVRSLVERFQPGVVHVAYQPESTRIDGAAVADLLADRGELFPIADSPYRHGKLIEWRRGESRWALTGSPNLSAAALLRTATNGGNVELGVISPVTDSLMPARATDVDATAELPIFRRSVERAAARDVVLAAIIDDTGVLITTARPLSASAIVEYSLPNEPPERWRSADQVAAGNTEHRVDLPLPAGSRLRLAFVDGAATPAVFVTSVEAVNRVRAARSLGPRTPEIGDVLTDPEAAEKFWSILLAEPNRVRAPRGVSRPTVTRRNDGDRSTTMGDWAGYLDRCRGQFGSRLLSFALGLPDLHVESPSAPRPTDWDDEADFSDEVGALEDDDTNTVLPDPPEPLSRIKERMAEAKRAKYRTFAERRTAEARSAEPHEALIGLRLVLLLAAGEAWNSSDLSWTELLLRATAALESCEGPELEDAAGSLAAVALAVIDHTFATIPTKVDRSNFRKTVDRVAHLLVAADANRIAEYGTGLNRFASRLKPAEVLRLRDLLVNDDPLELSLKALDDEGVAYTRRGALLLLDVASSNPLLTARAVWVVGPRLDNVAVRAPGKVAGQWAAVVRAGPDQIEIRTGGLPGSVLVHHVRRIDVRWTTIADTHAKQPVPPESVEVLERLGLSLDGLRNA